MKPRLAAGTVIAVSLLGAAAALAAPKPGKWRGLSWQTPSYPLTFGVTRNRKAVTDFRPKFIVTCTKRNVKQTKTFIITTDTGTNIPIRGGAFNRRFDHAEIHNGTALYAVGRETVAGTFFSKTTAAGTYSLSFTFDRSAPNRLPGYHCVSGKVRWSARHA